jgi:thioredoxin 1
MESENVRIVTDDNFEEIVLRSTKPVLLDFWAEWCGPCRLMLPVLDEIARENGSRITVATLNVEENPQRTAEFNVTSMPTLHLYRHGRLVHTMHGARPKSRLLGELGEQLAWS